MDNIGTEEQDVDNPGCWAFYAVVLTFLCFIVTLIWSLLS